MTLHLIPSYLPLAVPSTFVMESLNVVNPPLPPQPPPQPARKKQKGTIDKPVKRSNNYDPVEAVQMPMDPSSCELHMQQLSLNH